MVRRFGDGLKLFCRTTSSVIGPIWLDQLGSVAAVAEGQQCLAELFDGVECPDPQMGRSGLDPPVWRGVCLADVENWAKGSLPRHATTRLAPLWLLPAFLGR
jgi:hypothetical protein